MLWRRQEAKKLPIALDGDKKEVLLRGLAFAMMQRQVRDLPRADVLDGDLTEDERAWAYRILGTGEHGKRPTA